METDTVLDRDEVEWVTRRAYSFGQATDVGARRVKRAWVAFEGLLAVGPDTVEEQNTRRKRRHSAAKQGKMVEAFKSNVTVRRGAYW